MQLYLNTLNCGSQTCGRALSTIEEVAEDLETAIIFAGSSGLGYSPETPSTPTSATLYSSGFNEISASPTAPAKPKRHTSADFSQIILHLQACLAQFDKIQTQQQLATTVDDTLRGTVNLVESVRKSTAHLAQSDADAQVVALRTLRSAALAVAEAIRTLKMNFAAGNNLSGEDGNDVKKRVDVAAAAAVSRVEEVGRVVEAVALPEDSRGERLLYTLVNGLLAEMKVRVLE